MLFKKLTATVLSILFIGVLPFTAFAGWQEENPLIAHALGESDGKIETNSKEAFLEAWGSGFRALEVDFTYTSDGVLVARHDFEATGSYYRLEQEAVAPLVMDRDTFLNAKIVYDQTPLTAVDVLNLMVEYPDVYLITDTKNTDQATVQKQFGDLKKISQAIEHPEVMERIIPQLYNEEMYDWVMGIYPFKELIYTLYLNYYPDYPKIAAFCAEKGIGTVTIEAARVTKEITDTLHGKNIKVYAHTINRYKQFEELMALGVDGIYTDRIKPYQLPWVGLADQRKPEQKTMTLGEKEYTFHTLSIFQEDYTPLRQLSPLGKKFAAEYDSQTKAMNLIPGRSFTSLGNELLVDKSGKLIMKKADFSLLLNGKATGIRPIVVDGEVYVPLHATLTALGLLK